LSHPLQFYNSTIGAFKLDCIIVNATRSHLCHPQKCENAYHSLQKVQKDNSDQKCHKAALEAMEGRTARQAADFARSECKHMPKCWPSGSLPGINDKDTAQGIRIRVQNPMETAGICQICDLDFPVHLGRSLSGKYTAPLYTKNSRSANIDLKELQNNTLLTLQFTRPREWFQAYYNHHTIKHCATQLNSSTAR
jgi:hypothetical protein